jgi:peroxisomal membrane protein 4
MDDTLAAGAVAAYRGLMQGLYYGAKVRLPHAAVMTLLFSTGTLRAKLRTIASLTFQHARNLAAFVALYG